ncbi:MAG: type III-B CRISPR module RAMP protein Cmr1 [Promethearchaeota archaeon]
MPIKAKIKTPIWTGDIDGISNVIQSTGIMGSLRWWFEVILRGMGSCCCDPTNNNLSCPIPVESNGNSQYCLACLIFGNTGMRKLFRLEINGGRPLFNGNAINIRPSGRSRGW